MAAPVASRVQALLFQVRVCVCVDTSFSIIVGEIKGECGGVAQGTLSALKYTKD
jgi:hypothetical protein